MNFLWYLYRPIQWLLQKLFVELPLKLIHAPRHLVALSVPARVAVLVALFLIICVVTVGFIYLYDETQVPWRSSLTKGRVAAILILTVVIPIVVYKALQLWLQGDASRFPDIDFAWKTGLAELERNGLDLNQVPIFLVLGTHGETQVKSVFNAARLSLRVRDVPQGAAALHWFANPDGIYLVCTETGCLSKLASVANKLAHEATTLRPEPVAPMSGVRGTIMPDAVGAGSIRASQPVTPGMTESSSSPSVRGTMVVGASHNPAEDASAAPTRETAALSAPEAAEQIRRLEYVCELLRRARQPLCPANGVLTLLPFGLMQQGPGGAREVQKAVKADMATISRTLKLRCPVTALVVGMEDEGGFRELVRRVGLDRALVQRFGKGFGVWNPPIPEQLEALCAHACGAFEDWVYSLFKERGAITKEVGNKKLYSLLCKVRRDLKDRLTNLVVAAYGHDPEQQSDDDAEPLLFGGCYFAATGDVEYHQAFLKGVVEKLPEQQEEIEWTQGALREDRRYRQLAYFAVAVNGLLLVAICGMLVYKTWFAGS